MLKRPLDRLRVMTKPSPPHFLIPTWVYVFTRFGRVGFTALRYLRRQLDWMGLYPGLISNATLVELIRMRMGAWESGSVWKRPMKWNAGLQDRNMRNPEGIKTCFDWDIAEFEQIFKGNNDSYSVTGFAKSALIATGREPTRID